MTRRDTILIACLINAGLLVLLFATASTSEGPAASQDGARVAVVAERSAMPSQRPQRVVDVVDQVLEQYASEPEPQIVSAFPESIAPVATPAAEAPQQRFVEVTVKRGDSLERIARGNGSSVAALMEANNLSSTRLQIGQVLRVPLRENSEEVAVAAAEPEPAGRYYIMRSGDNPWLIAMKFHIPLDDLLALNDLDERSAKRLKPGDRIRIR